MIWGTGVRILRLLGRAWTILLALISLALLLALALRAALPHAPWIAQPALVASDPLPGATDVLPRKIIHLSFSQPMNRQSVIRSLRIEPPVAYTSSWNDDGRELVIAPAAPLISAITYTLRLDQQALSRWWRPLAQPVTITFRTARAPSVTAALPAGVAVPPAASIALVFSQPMVLPAQVGVAVALPELSFAPPVAAEARWINLTTLLLRPAEPLQPNTRYRGTLAPTLADARGTELGRPFSWTWDTAGPSVLAHSPAADARWVSPSDPLVLTITPPLALPALRRSLVITPHIDGELTAARVGATQVVTYTPGAGWQPGSAYTVELRGAASAGSWRFTAEPLPGLVGRFPGQGQILPNGQGVRLIFATPMDEEALRAGMALDPPAAGVSLSVNETEVRLWAEFRPSTAYTLTIDPAVTDRSGVPVGTLPPVRFLTAPAAPALSLPTAASHIVQLPVGRPVALPVERTNLSALDLALYRLDETTLLRTLDFSADDWSSFQPDRYSQPLLYTWRLPLDDPPNQVVRGSVPISPTASAGLDPGAYYLRVRSAEGPTAHVVLLVARVTLALKQSAAQVLVWATERGSGAPVADLPVTLYQGNTVVDQGRTDARGIWQIDHQRRAGSRPYLVIASAPEPVVVRGDWQLDTGMAAAPGDDPRYQLALLAGRDVYVAGQPLALAGFVRRTAANGSLQLPAPGARLDLSLEQTETGTLVASRSATISASGSVSATLDLDPALAPGAYTLRAALGNAASQLPILVVPPAPPFTVDLELVRGSGVALRATSVDLPIAGAAVSWTVRLAPAPIRASDAFVFADDELPPPEPATIAGSGATDGDGLLIVPLPELATITQTLRVSVLAQVQEPGGLAATAAMTFDYEPAGSLPGLSLPAQFVRSTERAAVELLAISASGEPVAGAPLAVEVFRRTPASGGSAQPPRETLVFARRVTTNERGQAALTLLNLAPGEYRVVARSGALRSAATLRVYEPGLSRWGSQPGPVTVVAERPVYQPGDVARLLVTAPVDQAPALVTLERGGTISAELRLLRASQPLTISVDAAPETVAYAGVLVAPASGGAPLAAYAPLPMAARPPLVVAVATDRPAYLPGSTAMITITTRDIQGQPAPADLVVALRRPGSAPPDSIGAAMARREPAAAITASSQPPESAASRQLAPGTAIPAPWPAIISLRSAVTTLLAATGDDGAQVLRLPLPDETGPWQLLVYAASGADQFGQAGATLPVAAPLTIHVAAPPFLRPGDQAAAALLVRNTSPLSQTVQAGLSVTGAIVASDPAAQRQRALPSGGVGRFAWLVSATGAPTATLRFTAAPAGAEPLTTTFGLPVLAGGGQAVAATVELTSGITRTLVISTGLRQSSGAPGPPGARLEIAAAPTVRAALAGQAAALAALPVRGAEQEASLALLSAALARGGDQSEQLRWSQQARRSLAALAAAQRDDGGWGWWAGTPTDPFVTGYVLEAQIAVWRLLGLAEQPGPRTLALLRQAARPGADPDLRAYIHYVMTLAGQGDPAGAAALLQEDLRPDGLAYLALALPPRQAIRATERLLATVRRSTDAAGAALAGWEPGSSAALARSPTAATALAALALQRQQPASAFIDPALRAVRLQWGTAGWPTSFDAARAAAALLERSSPATLPSRPTVLLNGQPLAFASAPLTATLRTTIAGDGLLVPGQIQARATGGTPALLAYRLQLAGDVAASGSPAMTAYQDYVNPVDNTPIDPGMLRSGQIIRVRLTLVASQPAALATLEAAVPAGLEIVAITPEAPFVHASSGDRSQSITLMAAALEPGVYTQTYLARAVTAGDFSAPPPRAAPAFDPAAAGIGNTGRIIIARP